MKLSVLGAGAWGTALAIEFAHQHEVGLWVRDPVQADQIASHHTNERYLPAIAIPRNIVIYKDLAKAVQRAELLIIATPMAGFRDTLQALLVFDKIPPLLWACKGFEAESGWLPHRVLTHVLPHHQKYGALCGPSFANELARGLPTAITIASPDEPFAYHVAQSFSTQRFRLYANTDLIGAEVGAAVKNIMAIACGILDGLKLGLNARAALITRSLAEITLLTLALGGQQATLSGLSGIGDLILTCTGSLSRNRQLGLKLATGLSLQDSLKTFGHVVEGVQTTHEVQKLATQYQLEMPITDAVYRLLTSQISPHDIASILMDRKPKLEFGRTG